MADPPAPRTMAVPLTAFTAGAVLAVLLGVFGKVHDPTLEGTTTLGFDTVIEMKVVLTTVIGVLAVLQVVGALWLYGKLGIRAPSWLGTAHRISGTTALLLSVFVAYHCLWALGLETGRFHDGTKVPMRTVARRRPRLRGLRRRRREGDRSPVPARARLVPAGGRWPAVRTADRRRADLGRLVPQREGLAGYGRLLTRTSFDACEPRNRSSDRDQRGRTGGRGGRAHRGRDVAARSGAAAATQPPGHTHRLCVQAAPSR